MSGKRTVKKGKRYSNFFPKKYCNIRKSVIYYKSLLKAMKWEVAELSGNFH